MEKIEEKKTFKYVVTYMLYKRTYKSRKKNL